jgi:hypothetical protein
MQMRVYLCASDFYLWQNVFLMLRYVVLHHTGIESPHYDLMLELSAGSDLTTWRVPNWPPRQDDAFTPLPDHRRDYLEYEGPISGNRGDVKRVAAGSFRITHQTANELAITLESDQEIRLEMRA